MTCHSCEDTTARDAHAAGYAEAEGDIRQMLRDERDATISGVKAVFIAQLETMLDNGAHVGAAKKGGAT